MKLLLVAYEYPPNGSGIANLVYNQKKSFTKLGHTVNVLSTNKEADITIPLYFLIQRTGGLGICLFWLISSLYLLMFNKKYDRIYFHNPICVYTPKNSILIMHTLYKFMLDDISHSKIMRLYNYLMYSIENLSYLFYTKKPFIITSDKSASELKSYNCKNIITKIPNGIEKRLIILNQSKKDYTFITVSRLSKQKNLSKLIQIFNALPNYKLKIIGDGELREKLEQSANDNIIFLGKLPHEDVFKHYASSNFFISASSYEGYPLTLSEAIGSGCIPILSEIPVYQEVISSLGCGLLYNYKDASFLKNYVDSVDLPLCQKKCNDYALQNLDWDIIGEKYLAL